MNKARLTGLLEQMIDCVDTLNSQDNLTFDSTYQIIKDNTDISDSELCELNIDMDYIKKWKE